MRILLVSNGFPPFSLGGIEIYTKNLAKELSRQNEVAVAYPNLNIRRPGLLLERDESGMRMFEISTPSWPFRYGNPRRGFQNPEVDNLFRVLLDRFDPDLVHFQHVIWLSSTAVSCCKRLGIPVALTLHDYWFICHMIKLMKMDGTLCEGPDAQAVNCSSCFVDQTMELAASAFGFTRNPALSRALRTVLNTWSRMLHYRSVFSEREQVLRNLLINEIDLLIATSEDLRDRFVAHGIPQEKFVVSITGIDTVPFDGFRKRAHQTLRFGFVGKIAPAKGVHVLIDAFNRIRDSSAELRIYGDFNPTKQEYHRWLLSESKNPRVSFVGRYDSIVDPWSDIDVLVFPSIWHETYPQVVREAFITRTPVVASRIGSLPEMVQDGVNGFLFEMGNAEDLSAKMKVFLDNPDLVDTLAASPASVRSIADESIALAGLYRMIMSK